MTAPTPRERLSFRLGRLQGHVSRVRDITSRPTGVPWRDAPDSAALVALILHRALEDLLGMGSTLVRNLTLVWSGDPDEVFDLLAGAGTIPAGQGALLSRLTGNRQTLLDGDTDVSGDLADHHLDDIVDGGRLLLDNAPDRPGEAGPGLDHLIVAHRDALLALASLHGLTDLRVYGSMARGDADDHSDVDLLCSTSPLLDYLALGQAAMAAEGLLQRPVSLLTEGELVESWRARILGDAVAL